MHIATYSNRYIYLYITYTDIYQHIATDHPYSYDTVIGSLSCCMQSICDWFLSNGLTSNPDKTQLVLLGSTPKLYLGNLAMINVAGCMISLVSLVKSLCVPDSVMIYYKPVNNICQLCYVHIRALHHVQSSLTSNTANTVTCAIVGAQLNCCNSLLYHISRL